MEQWLNEVLWCCRNALAILFFWCEKTWCHDCIRCFQCKGNCDANNKTKNNTPFPLLVNDIALVISFKKIAIWCFTMLCSSIYTPFIFIIIIRANNKIIYLGKINWINHLKEKWIIGFLQGLFVVWENMVSRFAKRPSRSAVPLRVHTRAHTRTHTHCL